MRQRIFSFICSVILFTGVFSINAAASTDWPSDLSIESDAGIVMDADTGTVLYGKNIHETYSPASITKVLTALIVLEHCSMDEVITYSENAVYNVESNSSSAGYDTGDTATVMDSLYALLLKSANESANALAEHISGTTEEFAVLMNEKAAELGCVDSNFANPSGLNDENHKVSAYDMALITAAAFRNEEFYKIISTTYYELPPNATNPGGLGVSPGNQMVKKRSPQYREDVIGGKTGYTSIALNTLVTGARQEDTTLVTVILHSSKTQYEDTKRLLDFGFDRFRSIKLSDYDQTFSAIGDDLKIAGIPTPGSQTLTLSPDSRIILPKTAEFSETTVSLDYSVPAEAPSGTIAIVNYYLGERPAGQAYLTLSGAAPQAELALPDALLEVQPSILTSEGSGMTAFSAESAGGSVSNQRMAGPTPAQDIMNPSEASEEDQSGASIFRISLKVPILFWLLLAAILVIGGGGTLLYFILKKRREREYAAQQERRRRRAERLRETGISEAEFNMMIKERRHSDQTGSRKRILSPGHYEE